MISGRLFFHRRTCAWLMLASDQWPRNPSSALPHVYSCSSEVKKAMVKKCKPHATYKMSVSFNATTSFGSRISFMSSCPSCRMVLSISKAIHLSTRSANGYPEAICWLGLIPIIAFTIFWLSQLFFFSDAICLTLACCYEVQGHIFRAQVFIFWNCWTLFAISDFTPPSVDCSWILY